MKDFAAIIMQHLSRVTLNPDEMANDAFSWCEADFSKANREQLMRGMDSVGDSIGTYKSYGGVSYKGTPLNPVNLYLTGDFHRKIDSVAITGGVEVFNTSEILEELEYVYGDKIIGVDLDADTADELFDNLAEAAIYSAKRQLHEQISNR